VAAAAQLSAVIIEGLRRPAASDWWLRQSNRYAGRLGNTPSVRRASCVDPRLIDRFHSGECIKVQIGRREQGGGTPDLVAARQAVEVAVIDLVSEAAALS